jgi:hypothetical protein
MTTSATTARVAGRDRLKSVPASALRHTMVIHGTRHSPVAAIACAWGGMSDGNPISHP